MDAIQRDSLLSIVLVVLLDVVIALRLALPRLAS
jgi:hypothetical protein